MAQRTLRLQCSLSLPPKLELAREIQRSLREVVLLTVRLYRVLANDHAAQPVLTGTYNAASHGEGVGRGLASALQTVPWK